MPSQPGRLAAPLPSPSACCCEAHRCLSGECETFVVCSYFVESIFTSITQARHAPQRFRTRVETGAAPKFIILGQCPRLQARQQRQQLQRRSDSRGSAPQRRVRLAAEIPVCLPLLVKFVTKSIWKT